jgi:TolB-like protein
MADNPTNFWQELKRRRVIRVIPVYLASAFVLLELVDIIAEPFGLPDWTLKFVFVLLCIGFVISIILSWVYDITPEGVKKTKSATKDKNQPREMIPQTIGWKWATYASLVIIIGLITLNIFVDKGKKANTIYDQKSIAVLPFKCLSDDPEKQYLADGVMDAILLHLSKIKDLRVLARTSVEQYRETSKTVSEIGKELKVAYILEASFQKYGNNARLIVQLIRSSDDGHVWANEYDREWADIFAVQSEVAKTIAKELNTVITPEEEHLINKEPTPNISAYDLYLKASDFGKKFKLNNELADYHTAVNLYKEVLATDSTYAAAYAGLAGLYYERYFFEDYFKEDFLDSCLILANTALSFDNDLEEAYFWKGFYYRHNGDLEKALINYDKALKINPNYSQAYRGKGYLLTWIKKDYIGGIENYQKALSLIYGKERQNLLNSLIRVYADIGIIDKAEYYIDELLKLNGDSLDYFDWLAWAELIRGNFEQALKIAKKCQVYDSTFHIAPDYYNCLPSSYSDEIYQNAKDDIKWREEQSQIPLQYTHRFGYAFWMVGKEEEALQYFEKQIEYGEESIRLNRSIAQLKAAQYDLAGTYTFLGEKEKAYKNLEDWSQMNTFPLWWVTLFKNDPLFNNIRNEQRFQQITHDVEAKYQAEHEKVKKWLEEQGMLVSTE